MEKFHWTPAEILSLSIPQYLFIIDGMKWESEEKEKARKRAKNNKR